jgi:hypothetical protein
MGDDVTLPAVPRHRFYQKFSTITFHTGGFMACAKRDLISSSVLQKSTRQGGTKKISHARK